MNQAQIEAITTALPDLYDPEYNGWMIEAVETRETLADFEAASKNYAERTAPIHGTVAGFPFIGWREVQVSKGAARRSLTVIDFGDVRVAIDADPRDLK